MKLNQISLLLSAFFLVVFLNSCNDSNDNNTSTVASADAQVYGFALSAIPITSIDSVNFPILKTAKFAINQDTIKGISHIYNPDSLPYRTRLTKYAMSIAFSSASPSKIEILYKSDSVIVWNGSDSIDFKYLGNEYPKLRVTAANGSTVKTYKIDVLIHKVDPDSIVWQQMAAQPTTVGKQKTILKGNDFYTFSSDGNNALSLYIANKSSLTWSRKQTVNGLPNTVLLESIQSLNGVFFAVDNAKKAYTSTNGTDWGQRNTNVVNILGVLPDRTAAKDSLAVIVESAGQYYFAKTIDMQTLRKVSVINEDFPINGFYSATNYDRSNLNNNLLSLVGGKPQNGVLQNTTWTLHVDASTNLLEVIPSQTNPMFTAKAGIASFFYNGYLYALTQNSLFKTSSFGYTWTVAPTKESLYSTMPKASGQTVIVDADSYIWIFGGVSDSGNTPVRQVWRGRLTKLNPKIISKI